MDTHYTAERNAQIVLYLLKTNNIKKVVASPGTTNITLVASMQQDPWFEMYSAADERSAAYIACGLAAESGEPVVLSCTGATASRNYIPGLTEAFYRKLPIIAITATQASGRIGSYTPQVIDRTQIQHDIAVYSTTIRTIKDDEDESEAEVKANKAMYYLRKYGGGPVHINLETQYASDFSIKSLPSCRVIRFYDTEDELPKIDAQNVGIFIGTHAVMSEEETELIDRFCAQYNGAVFCDHTSNYHGKYKVEPSILGQQEFIPDTYKMDLVIYIGYVSAGYPAMAICNRCKRTWRVNKDGEVRNFFGKTNAVFQMSENFFFRHYAPANVSEAKTELRDKYRNEIGHLLSLVPEDLPFSNGWIAKTISKEIPDNSVMHFGILNSIRHWDMFPMKETVNGYVNAGGFGIDGCMSSMIGASLVHPDKLYFLVIGDLAFFYDLNSIANRHVGHNVRILLVNNGKGTEFRNYNHKGAQFGDDADEYIAAARHYGNKSHKLIKHFAEDLGYEYLTASNKDEFMKAYPAFVNPAISHSMIFEVFTNNEDESNALYMLNHLIKPTAKEQAIKDAKATVKKVVGKEGVKAIKKILGK